MIWVLSIFVDINFQGFCSLKSTWIYEYMDLPLQTVNMYLTSINIWFHWSLIPQKLILHDHSKLFCSLTTTVQYKCHIIEQQLLYFIYRVKCTNNYTRRFWLCTRMFTWAGRGVCWPIRLPTCWERSPGTPHSFISPEPNSAMLRERRRMFHTVFHFLNFGLLLGIIQCYIFSF